MTKLISKISSASTKDMICDVTSDVSVSDVILLISIFCSQKMSFAPHSHVLLRERNTDIISWICCLPWGRGERCKCHLLAAKIKEHKCTCKIVRFYYVFLNCQAEGARYFIKWEKTEDTIQGKYQVLATLWPFFSFSSGFA